ncbi:MAG: succinate dehydrogenase [Thermomicrobiaceae bacterium]|nr:succinate dehydrogenase [Thermomicrobiaceae bacterium]
MSVIPRAESRRVRGGNFELISWYFMRISGLLLLGLVFGHLVAVHVATPIDNVDFQFVQNRYATPFWRIYDWLMLTLALFHGLNGVHLSVDDYLYSRGWRLFGLSVLAALLVIFFVVGTYNILAFTA